MSYYAKNPHDQDETPRCPCCDQPMRHLVFKYLRQDAWECGNPDCLNYGGTINPKTTRVEEE